MAPAKALLAAFPAIHKTPGPHGIPLLSHAIVGKKQSLGVFHLLLGAGADVNAAAWRGTTPLMQAVLADQMDMASALLERGADRAAKLPDGTTALDFARKKNKPAMIALLSKALRPAQE